MSFIEPITEDGAGADAAAVLESNREWQGYVTNYARAFARRPEVDAAWRALLGAITASLDPRRYELVTLAAASELRSSYCCLAHGRVLAERFVAPEVVAGIVRDRSSAELEPVDVAVMDLAALVVRDATSVTQADIDRLRDLGLSDDEIFDVVAAAGARCFLSKTLDALGVEPDSVYRDLAADLRDALVVGRPIAPG
jgi:uncharacterized peroxidase-related enzyme